MQQYEVLYGGTREKNGSDISYSHWIQFAILISFSLSSSRSLSLALYFAIYIVIICQPDKPVKRTACTKDIP